MIVDCHGNESEGLHIKIILSEANLESLKYAPITVEVPASNTEYGSNTRIIIERD